MAKTTNTIENFPERFAAKLEEFLQANPQFVDADGKPGGYFSAGINSGNLRISFIPFGAMGVKNIYIALGTHKALTSDETDLVNNAVKTICGQYGFFPNVIMGQPHNKTTLTKEIETAVKNILLHDPEFSTSSGTQRGIFSITLDISKNDTIAHSIVINVRPYGDIEKVKDSYVKIPHLIKFSIGTENIEESRRLVAFANEALQEMGFQKRELHTKIDLNKIIPKDWIDASRITIRKPPATPNYYLIVVSVMHSLRLPQIKFSTGLIDEALVERAKTALCAEYLAPRLKEDNEESITLRDMQTWLSGWLGEQGYQKTQQERRETALPQIVELCNPYGEQKCVFFTPGNSATLQSKSITLRIAPWKEERPTKDHISCVSFSVNTDNLTLAKLRGQIINRIAIATLSDYFARYPDAQFATEPRTIRYKGQDIIFTMMCSHPALTYSLNPTVIELTSLLAESEDRNPDTSTLAYALSQAITREGVNESRSEELESSLKRALRSEAVESVPDVASQLDIAMLSGVKDFLRRHPQYQVWKTADGEALGVEVNRAMNIDAAYLSDQILRPAVKKFNDYPRFIVWDMRIEPVEAGDKTGPQVLKVKAIKNPLSTNEPAEPPWDKEFTLHAETAEHAQAFIKAVEDHFYNDSLTGRPRPVEQFGSPSQAVVFRESLGAGLSKSGITIPDDSPVGSVLEQLQRKALKPRVRDGAG